jgi:hypothetical protein
VSGFQELERFLLRGLPEPPRPTQLQELQLGLLDLVDRSRLLDERVALAFRSFLIEVAAREGVKGTWQ